LRRGHKPPTQLLQNIETTKIRKKREKDD